MHVEEKQQKVNNAKKADKKQDQKGDAAAA